MDNSPIYYGKKVDSLVYGILVVTFMFSILPMLYIDGSAWWILLIVNGLSLALIFWLFNTTETAIIEGRLEQSAGPIKWVIAIENIKKIRRKTKSYINNGTWSLDKMDILYFESYIKTLTIAPLRREELISKLLEINPNIEIE